MKTKLTVLFLFFPFLFTTIIAQTTAIPDANFEQFLVDQGYDSNGVTGDILNSDAQAVTQLNFNRNDIANFTGLEAFTNITILRLADNQFTTLPLDVLTKLEIFYCRDNEILTSLDFSKNIALRILHIERDIFNRTSYNRPITNLDLSANINLEDLIVKKSTNLTNISLPITATLKKIEYDGLALGTIDISRLDGLENFIIKYNTGSSNLIMPNVKNVLKNFTIQGINVTSFDIISEYISLESLSLLYTGIGSLKLPATDTFKRLVVLHHDFTSPISFDIVPNLEHIEIRDAKNVPLEIDVTKNSKLRSLILWNNKMTSLDVTQNKVLNYLTLRRNNLTSLDVTQNTQLTSLNVGINNLTSLDISNCIILSKLEVYSNQLIGNDILQQYYTIRKNDGGLKSSNELDVGGNYLSGVIPDFSELVVPGVTTNFDFDFAYNKFEFGDFEDQHARYLEMRQNGEIASWSYDYAAQRKVDEVESIAKNTGESIVLTTTVSGKQNHYKWYKDKVAIAGAPDSPNLELTNITSCDSGVYYCEVTSDLVPFENSDDPGYNGKNLLLVRNDITLTINSDPLACVSLSTPLNGVTQVPITTTLEWNKNNGACGYKISAGTSSGGTDIANNIDLGNALTYSFATDLPENTTIYVNIIPYNKNGDLTSCIEESFTTAGVPECTSLINPLNGATDVPVTTGLQWNASVTADGYRLSVGTTSGASDIVNNLDVGNTTSYNFASDLPENTKIYVSIIPYNSAGDATGCSEESFTTETIIVIPDCTSLINPLNGATDVSVTTGLQWNVSATSDGYRLSVGTTSGASDIVNNLDVGNTTSYNFASDLPENTKIYVSIIPYNSAGDATGCSEESFTTETIIVIPDCTSLINPLNGATDVPVTTGLQWNGSVTADGYRLSVGTTSGATDIVNNLDVGNTTSYNFASDLPESTKIYVSIIPYNSAGDATGCSEESFTTETIIVIPDCTSLINPLNGATDVPVTTGLQWNGSVTADGYRLSVGTTSGATDIVNNLDVGNTTSYNFASDLPESTKIYVSIIPYNSVGDAIGCNKESFVVEEPLITKTTKYGVSPNGDGINDYWEIPEIENYPDNVVTIFNRWGDMVFKIKGYDNNRKVFRGDANRLTSLGAGKLPEGTYFYRISINGSNNLNKLQGFIVLKR
ncbi:T9SS type B sorting domain-containing protein [Tenacibaculum caenipelagi]|nr:gliding motility-associated C-terminal domain-containing protein [Tenacibaculum caenipelagi]